MTVWHLNDIRQLIQSYLEPVDLLCLDVCLAPDKYTVLPHAVRERVDVSSVLTSYSSTRSHRIEARLKMLSDNRATRYRTHARHSFWCRELAIVREQLEQCYWYRGSIIGKRPCRDRDVSSFLITYHNGCLRGNGNIDSMHTIYQLRLVFYILYHLNHSNEYLSSLRDALKFGRIKPSALKKILDF